MKRPPCPGEVGEDMWVPVPPSSLAALAGATVLVNLSGSPITVGRAEDRELLARSSSARGLAAGGGDVGCPLLVVAQRLEGVHVGHVAPQAHLLGGLGQLGGGVGVGLR